MLLPIGRIPHSKPCKWVGIWGEFDRNGRRHAVLAPHTDGVVFEIIHFAPTGEHKQRLVVRSRTKIHFNPYRSA